MSVQAAPPAAPRGVAYTVIDLQRRQPVATERDAVLNQPVLPGSVMKIAAIAAALESGVLGDTTGIACTRQVTVDRHRLVCVHPDLHRPLTAADALAQSCDVFAATIATRISRTAFDRVLTAFGLPLSDPNVSLQSAALGIGGTRIAPRRLVEMMARVAAEPSTLGWKPSTIAAIRAGLRDAARSGTASALAARGVDALAKTGTVLAASGVQQGLVVGVTPSSSPRFGFVLMTMGAAGADAAAVAADRIMPLLSRSSASHSLRVGISQPDGRYTLKAMDLEDYVAAALAGEAAPRSHPAALEALAIAIRTYARANRGRHGSEGFDLCDLTHCQIVRTATPAATRAASATAGRILTHDGEAASIYYSASCGGHTERPSEVWPGAPDPPFMPSRPDAACERAPAWSADLSAADLTRALRAAGRRGDTLRDLRIEARNGSGRVSRLRVDGFVPAVMSAQDFRLVVGRQLGWQLVKSTAFALRRTSAGFRFTGHGSGHGVGLCVVGSAKLAESGMSAREILARYFPGLELSGANIAIRIPESEERERGYLQTLVTRTTESLARTLETPVPAAIALQFHATVEAFQRATGLPWFTLGAAVGGELRFVPLDVLRRRNELEPVVRHELVHAMTDAVMKDRPLWVREGAAVYYAGEQAAAGSAPTASPPACPADAEFRRPVSSAALTRAYTRSAACFAAQIRAGKSWRDVR